MAQAAEEEEEEQQWGGGAHGAGKEPPLYPSRRESFHDFICRSETGFSSQSAARGDLLCPNHMKLSVAVFSRVSTLQSAGRIT